METYDLIVIGGGAAGLNMTIPAARIGLDTLLIEKNELGGECLNSGCVPSKKLLNIAKDVWTARNQPYGLKTSGEIDYSKVKEELDAVREKIGDKEEDLLDEENIDVQKGEATFTSSNVIDVNGKRYKAKNIVVATGTKPRPLELPGSDDVEILTYEDIWGLEEKPENLVIIGAGPVGVEMTQAFNRLGTDVILIQNTDEILPKEDPGLATKLRDKLEDEGVTVLTNAETKRFKNSNTIKVEYDDKTAEITFDKVMASIGKIHDHEGLGLKQAGIETDERGKIKTDSYLRTTNKSVYVCGDATGEYYFTHASEHEAQTILYNVFSPWKKKIRYDNISWVTYTDPELATFGMTKQELDEQNKTYKTLVNDFEDVNRADIENKKDIQQKLYLHNDKILGGTILAPTAGEIMQELILLKQNNEKLTSLKDKIYAYPLLSRVNRVTALEHLEETTPSWMLTLLRKIY